MLTESWNTLCILAPWLFLGALLAGLLHVCLPPNWLRTNLVGKKGVFKAVALGIPLPLCSCGVIPTGVGIKRSGASDGAAIGFLISTPQTGVDSILVSASFFGWPFAIFKMILAAITGIAGGIFANDTGTGNQTNPLMETSGTPKGHWTVRLVIHAIEVIQSVWIWLAVGIVISAAISVWIVPTDLFHRFSQSGLIPSIILMLIVSLPLYVCATASVPIAAALVAGGVPMAAALVFLIAGPATNIATIGAIYSQFGFRNLLVYMTTIIVGSVAGALLFDLIMVDRALAPLEHQHNVSGGFPVFCGVLLISMFAWFLFVDTRRWIDRRRRAKESTPAQDNPTMTFIVHGMTCGNCVNKIESALLRSSGIGNVVVDLSAETVLVSGNVQPDTVRQVIENAGFTVARKITG